MGRYKTLNTEVKIARQLGYSEKVIKLLKEEPDPNKRVRILHDARNGYYNDK